MPQQYTTILKILACFVPGVKFNMLHAFPNWVFVLKWSDML